MGTACLDAVTQHIERTALTEFATQPFEDMRVGVFSQLRGKSDVWIGLGGLQEGDDFGWNQGQRAIIAVRFTASVTGRQQMCLDVFLKILLSVMLCHHLSRTTGILACTVMRP